MPSAHATLFELETTDAVHGTVAVRWTVWSGWPTIDVGARGVACDGAASGALPLRSSWLEVAILPPDEASAECPAPNLPTTGVVRATFR